MGWGMASARFAAHRVDVVGREKGGLKAAVCCCLYVCRRKADPNSQGDTGSSYRWQS